MGYATLKKVHYFKKKTQLFSGTTDNTYGRRVNKFLGGDMKMGKMVLAMLMFVALVLSGCEAFDSSYNPTDKTAAPAGDVSASENGEAPATVSGTDYTTDTTACEHDMAIKVSLGEAEELGNSGWTSDFGEPTVSAEQLGDYSAKVSIKNDEGTLSFTIKKVADELFNVCDVTFEGCDGECVGVMSLWTKVVQGTIEIYKFMEDGKNAGSFDIEFDESSMGDPGLTLTGTYLSE